MHSFPNNNNNKATSISRTNQGRVKTVYYNHTQPFRNERHKKDTALSSQLRKLKKKANEIPKLTWSILKIVPEYSNILKRCLLCHFYLSIYLSIHIQMNINLQLKIKMNRNELKKRHSPVSRHFRMHGTKLKTIKFKYVYFKTN